MNIKMIVTDLDGTLLRRDKTISEYTASVFHRCRNADIKIVFATGRGEPVGKVAPSEIFDGRISMNGAVVMIDDTVIYSRLIPYQTARPLLIACDEHGMKITSENDTHYSNFVVSDIWPPITNFELVDFARHEKDAEKIYTPNPTPDDRLFIEQILPDDLYFVVTADGTGYLGMIMHKEATKAKAVAALAQYWGISQSETAAFGDDYNDIEMLRDCGIGVAVANAIDEVKAAADYICDSNENDGVAKWLEERILI